MRGLLATDLDLEKAFDRLISLRRETPESAATVQMVVPQELLVAGPDALAKLLDSLLEEYEEIDTLLSSLREQDEEKGEGESAEVTSLVSHLSVEELEDPESLSGVLAPLTTDRAKFEYLFGQAKSVLDRLDSYHLSERSTNAVVDELRADQHLKKIQYLVEFLRSLHSAADSFEALDLPSSHIRDYLTHLYRMGDWREMRRLVHHLEIAVGRLLPVSSKP